MTLNRVADDAIAHGLPCLRSVRFADSPGAGIPDKTAPEPVLCADHFQVAIVPELSSAWHVRSG
ncbi:hypothetical protein D3C74_409030 [compost metagenome]